MYPLPEVWEIPGSVWDSGILTEGTNKFSAKKRQRLPESVLEGWGLHMQRFDLHFTPSTKLAKSKSHT